MRKKSAGVAARLGKDEDVDRLALEKYLLL